jgi:hypothetical protein
VNVNDFRSRVHARAGPDLTYGAVAKAVEEFIRRRRLTERDVADCIIYAGQLGQLAAAAPTFEVVRPARRGARRGKHALDSRQPEDARVDQILSVADGVVRGVRLAAFNTQNPPFESVSEAVEWLKARAPSETEMWRLRKKSIPEIQRAENALERANAIDPFTFSQITETMQRLLDIQVPHSGPLGTLARDIQYLTRTTGLVGMSEYVFAGVRPPSPRPVFQIFEEGLSLHGQDMLITKGWPSNGSWRRLPRVKIKLDACLVTEHEFRGVYAAVRQSLGLKNKRPANRRDRLLIAAVDSLGGRPVDHPNRKAFWEAVVGRPELKKLFSTAAAAREAYGRALKRANSASG